MTIILPKNKKPSKLAPELLATPATVIQLSGVTPRSIMGPDWWKLERAKALAKAGFHCICCGANSADLTSPLEGHEVYEIDYKKAVMTYKHTVAVCKLCHAAIHNKRLVTMHSRKQLKLKDLQNVYKHAKNVWKTAYPDKPLPNTIKYIRCYIKTRDVKLARQLHSDMPSHQPWNAWRLAFNLKLYPPKFTSFPQLQCYYIGAPYAD